MLATTPAEALAPSSLDSPALARRLAQLAGDERAVQVEFLLHLDVFDRRRAWAEAGYPSLWSWCQQVLHLREGAAWRRIAAMRVLRRFPQLADRAPKRTPRKASRTTSTPPAEQGRPAIPAAVRREVWRRDGGRCAWRGPDGHRCGSTWQLELDHLTPVALGGLSTAANLRVACRVHNQHAAEQVFGREAIARARSRRERRPLLLEEASPATNDGAAPPLLAGASPGT